MTKMSNGPTFDPWGGVFVNLNEQRFTTSDPSVQSVGRGGTSGPTEPRLHMLSGGQRQKVNEEEYV